jgi:pimeloyl-ACP methyl ester carboxylesterase
MNTLKKILTSTIAAMALGLTVPAVQAAPVKNVILVHGAFADGSGWQSVYELLKRKGYAVSVVQQAETSIEDDIQAVRRVIAMQDGPAVLVAHSYAGELITEAGTDPKITALVYIAAAVPDVGESLGDLFKRFPSPTGDALKPAGDGFLMLNPNRFRDAFAADLPEKTTDFMAHSQVMISETAFGRPVKVAAWKTKPSYGIIAGADRTASPDLERFMYERANAKITVIAGASHAVYISHPDKVVKVIDEAAKR